MAYNAKLSYYGALWKPGNIDKAARKAAESTRKYGVTLLKATTPIKSGALSAAWEARVSGNGILWRNSRPYAQYVELGTKRMAGRHMLEKALPSITNHFKSQLMREIGTLAAKRVLEAQPISYDNSRSFN